MPKKVSWTTTALINGLLNLLSYFLRVGRQAKGGNAREMGTQRCLASDRTDFATETTCRWSRSPVAGHARSDEWSAVGFGHGGAVARTAREISAVPDLPSRFQQWVREGKLERILRALAKELQARGKLQLKEAFIDASSTGAKKGASRSGPLSAARGRKSSPSPMITVFLSPLVSKAPRRTRASLSKESWDTASSTPSPHD
jgi:hypothetical protein